MKNLDCRGLACPGPVIQVKKELENTAAGGSFSIDLDSEASRDNVLRFARSRGAAVREEGSAEGVTRIVITVPDGTRMQGLRDTVTSAPVVMIAGDTLGRGDDKLGRILMEGFINGLPDQDRPPDRILFLNAGVKLAVQGSPVLESLGRLTDLGCEILACGTCLDFFSLKEHLAVGTVSNMYDIQRILLEADSVIKV